VRFLQKYLYVFFLTNCYRHPFSTDGAKASVSDLVKDGNVEVNSTTALRNKTFTFGENQLVSTGEITFNGDTKRNRSKYIS